MCQNQRISRVARDTQGDSIRLEEFADSSKALGDNLVEAVDRTRTDSLRNRGDTIFQRLVTRLLERGVIRARHRPDPFTTLRTGLIFLPHSIRTANRSHHEAAR